MLDDIYIPLSSDGDYEMRNTGRYCPSCNSVNIFVKVNTSLVNYKCEDCGFNSDEHFREINFRNNRNNKIDEILNDQQR